MAFIKVQKTPQYFANFQPQKRRRREGKTDYKARRALVVQDLSKYGTPKYRFVVRRTNKRIIAQVVYATLEGDKVICSADSFELPRYGIQTGLKNYAASYCVGLLCARRLLTQLGMADQFVGLEEATGDTYHVEDEDSERRPFKCVLDIGLVRSTKGNRVFACMKGAVDGGLYIPHSDSCFAHNDEPELHLERILGGHIRDYQNHIIEQSGEDELKARFSSYVKHSITADSIPDMYKASHKAIRADPTRKPKDAEKLAKAKAEFKLKYPVQHKLSAAERKERVEKKIMGYAQYLNAQ